MAIGFRVSQDFLVLSHSAETSILQDVSPELMPSTFECVCVCVCVWVRACVCVCAPASRERCRCTRVAAEEKRHWRYKHMGSSLNYEFDEFEAPF